MNQEEYELLLRFFKVLSDSNRLKLLGLLATKVYCVDELATLLTLKPSVFLPLPEYWCCAPESMPSQPCAVWCYQICRLEA